MRPQPGYADDDTLELPRVRAASPSTAGAAEPSPVFVDSSGRRQRRVRRLGWLLVVPAAGYVVLVLSSLFGGPTLKSPFLPAPRSADAAPSKAPAAEPGSPSASAAPRRTPAAPAASQAPAPPAPASQATTGSGAPTAAPTPPAPNGNGASPGSGSAGQGKPTARPGQGGGKPTAHP
ncbi:hypothetical protein ACIPUC_18375 [Streptomyces sp. LARHCF249]